MATPGAGWPYLPASRKISKGVLRADLGCLAEGRGGQSSSTFLDFGATQAPSGPGVPADSHGLPGLRSKGRGASQTPVTLTIAAAVDPYSLGGCTGVGKRLMDFSGLPTGGAVAQFPLITFPRSFREQKPKQWGTSSFLGIYSFFPSHSHHGTQAALGCNPSGNARPPEVGFKASADTFRKF